MIGEPRRRPTILEAFRDPRWVVMLGLGFYSGLPNPLSHSTLKAWLTSEGIDMATIGYFSLVRLPFNLKFLWAPLIDRYRVPFLSRRRGWIALSQVCLFISIGLLGASDPQSAPWLVAAMAFLTAFFSASQDITADAYRTEFLPVEDRASGTALWVAAYRVALIISGSGALLLSDVVSWTVVYWIMAPLMLLGVLVTWLAPAVGPSEKLPTSLYAAVIEPLRSYLKRPSAMTFLVIILLYRVGEVLVGEFRIPFLLRGLEFTRSEVAVYDKALGLGFTIVGALLLVGGGFVKRWGLKRTMIVFGLLQAVTNALYAILAVAGKSYALLIVTISVDNLASGMGTAVFVAFLMTLCEKRFAAFQFALFSSLMTVPGLLLSGTSGGWIERVGWPTFFFATILVSLPALLLLQRVQIPEQTE